MRVSVIADVHCRGPNDPAQRSFVEWLKHLNGVDELWILGDLTHYGWVFDGRVHPDFQEVVDGLYASTQRGIHLVFVPGNHDFGLGAFFETELGFEVRDAHSRTIDGVRVALLHGDELDTSWAYRVLRWTIRSRGFATLLNVLGPRMGTAVLQRMAGDVSMGGDIWSDTREGLLQRLEQADMVLMGHVHTPWSYQGEEGTALVLTPGVPVYIEDGRLITAQPD